MKRTTKYTHITARTNKYLKQLSIQTCQDLCNKTLSWAWRRLNDEHKGLINIYDQESFELWTQVINGVRKISSPVHLTDEDYKKLNSSRDFVLKEMEDYRSWVEYGVKPEHLHDYYTTQELEIILLDLPPFLTQGENLHDCYIKNQKKLRAYIDKIEEEENISALGNSKSINTNNTVFQIRVDYSHKKSFSLLIKSFLEGIFDIRNKTTQKHRSVYASDMKIIESFNDWNEKVTKKVITLGDNEKEISQKSLKMLQNYLSKIKIPDYKSEAFIITDCD